jgi:hypothetical protein
MSHAGRLAPACAVGLFLLKILFIEVTSIVLSIDLISSGPAEA